MSTFGKLSDPAMLHDDNADQADGQDGPNNNKDPDIDLFICDTPHARPIDQ
jgi:hypothetical protein